MSCWRCREPVQGPVCPGCGAIQPPPPHPDLFQILGLPRSYALDRKQVDKAWRAVSRTTHPDRFAGAEAVQRRMALQWTAHLNEARRVLKNTRARAWYLATGNARAAVKGPALAPEFLEEIFELRMELDDAPQRVRERALEMRAQLDHELEELFSTWESSGEGLDHVPERLSRLKYIDNILSETAASPSNRNI